MSKPTNLKRLHERRGINAVNIFVKFNKVIRFDFYMTIQCAWHHHIKGECYTLSLADAVEKYPNLFTYQ